LGFLARLQMPLVGICSRLAVTRTCLPPWRQRHLEAITLSRPRRLNRFRWVSSVLHYHDAASSWNQCDVANGQLSRIDCCGPGATGHAMCMATLMTRSLGSAISTTRPVRRPTSHRFVARLTVAGRSACVLPGLAGALTRPHQVYTLGLNDLQAGQSLSAARPTSWRYLVERDDRPVALGETAIRASGKHAFAHLNYGPFVRGTAEALGAAEQYAAQGDADVRLLHIPALYLQALWLHSQSRASESEDILIPVAPITPGIEANPAYPARELLELLQERARSVPVMAEGDTRRG